MSNNSAPNYFELLGLNVAFEIDVKALHKAYIAAQHQCHPDKATHLSDNEKISAAHRSIDVNNAYKTLKSDLLRAKYLLKLADISIDHEPGAIKPSTMLLMESIELREALASAKGKDPLNHLLTQAKTLEEESSAHFATAYAQGNLTLAADHAIRLNFLAKFKSEVKQAIAEII